MSVGPKTATPPGFLAEYLLSIDISSPVPPRILADTLPPENSTTDDVLYQFQLTFSEDMLATTVNQAGNFDLREAGSDGQFDTPDDVLYDIASSGYASGLQQMVGVTDGPLQPGSYRFTARAAIKNRFGVGFASDYERFFSVTNDNVFVMEGRNNTTRDRATPLPLTDTAYQTVEGRGRVTDGGTTDFWSFSGQQGQNFLLAVENPGAPGNSSLHWRVENPDGSTLVELNSDNYGYGQSTPVKLGASGDYYIRVRFNAGYTGEYRFRVYLAPASMTAEQEDNGSPSAGTGLPMVASSQGLAGTALGYIRYAGDVDYFALGTITNAWTIFLSAVVPQGAGLAPVVSLYDAANNYMAEAVGGRAFDNAAQINITQTGSYYAVVRASGNEGGLEDYYSLNVQVVPTGTVSFPNLQVVNVDPPTGSALASGEPAAFDYVVKNVGNLPTGAADWTDRVVMSANKIYGDSDDIPLGVFSHHGALDVGASYTNSEAATIPDGVQGDFYIIAQTDFGNTVNELFLEGDNITVSTATFHVALASYPDLVVEGLHAAGPDANNTYTITWQTANRGTGGAPAGMRDHLVVRNLTTGTVVMTGDQMISGSLAPNAVSSHTASVTTSIPGAYQVAVTADADNLAWEWNIQGHAAAEQNTIVTSFNIARSFAVTVYANPAAGGQVTGGGTYIEGTQVTVTATADTTALPYYFQDWSELGVSQSSSPTYSFTVESDRQLVADFGLPHFQVAATVTPPGAGIVTGTGNYAYGAATTLVAQPAFGYTFDKWTEGSSAVGTDPLLPLTVTAARSLVANFKAANLLHHVTTDTSPSALATVTGAGTYTNNQIVTFTAPATITQDPYFYSFKQFTLNGVSYGTSRSFTKTFLTTDPIDIQLVAVYQAIGLHPQVINAFASLANPVPATTDLVVAVQFDRAMAPGVQPAMVLSNLSGAVPVLTAPVGGAWSTNQFANDTYRTPAMTVGAGVEGTNAVWLSQATDTDGHTILATNVLAVVVDTVPPVITGVGSSPAPASAIITWQTDSPSLSQVDFGPTAAYGQSTAQDPRLVTSHQVVIDRLQPQTAYHFRARSRDQAGNESVSSDFSFRTLPAPDLVAAALAVQPPTGVLSGQQVLIKWNDSNAGSGPAGGSWFDYLVISNLTSGQKLSEFQVFHDAAGQGDILSGTSQVVQQGFRLPEGPSGTGTIAVAVTVDYYRNLYDLNLANNDAQITFNSSIAPYPDLKIDNISFTPLAPQSGTTMLIQWGDTNAGSGAVTADFEDHLLVKNVNNGEVLLDTLVPVDLTTLGGSLASGSVVTQQHSLHLPDGPRAVGTVLVQINADANDVVWEYNSLGSGELNNQTSANLTVTEAPYPDLVVSHIQVPNQAFPGQNQQFIWVVSNVGNKDITGTWTDRVWLSDDSAVGNDFYLGAFTFTGTVPVGGSVTNTAEFQLPAFGSGNRWIVVRADADQAIFETSYDNNAKVSDQPMTVPAVLTLAVSSSEFPENAGASAAILTVTRNTPTQNDLEVTLTNTNPGAISVPESITIPAQSASVSVAIGAVADGLVTGPRMANIAVSAPGFKGADQDITIDNVDQPTLTVKFPVSSVAENAAPLTGTVTRNTGISTDLLVVLVCSNSRRLQVPTTTTIPAGQSSVSFSGTPLDNNLPNNPIQLSVSAMAPGFYGLPAPLTILDNDLPALTLALAETLVPQSAPNPATIATVTRSPITSTDLTLQLNSSDSGAATVPVSVTIPANAASATFPIGVVNDNLVHANRLVQISATVLDSTTYAAIDASTVSTTLTVIDDNNPTLSITLSSEGVVGQGTITGTVRRNTATDEALTAAISSSDVLVATVPSSVTIPSGASSATFVITGVSAGQGSSVRQTTITASASGYNSGQVTLNASDIDLPDLQVTNINLPANAVSGQLVNVSWTVANAGLSTAIHPWYDNVSVSVTSDGFGPQSIGQYTISDDLPMSQSYTRNAAVLMPANPGTYYLVVTSDALGTVRELSERNNAMVSVTPIEVKPAYRATVSAGLKQALPGTPIPLSGRAFVPDTGGAAPNVLVTVRILTQGTRRVINALTDALGNFQTIFVPLANEAGHYTVGADHPGVIEDPIQDQFDILGLRFIDESLSLSFLPNQVITGTLQITNLSLVPLTGLSAAFADNVSQFLQLSMTLPETLPGNGGVAVAYKLTAANVTAPVRGQTTINMTTREGVAANLPISAVIAPLMPVLSANPGSLDAGMVRGQQTVVSFDVVNSGGADTGPITLQLPDVPWMSAASDTNIPNIAVGTTNRLTLLLQPTPDLPLTEYAGSLALSTAQLSLNVPFRFRAISDAKGDLQVSVSDDFTYYVAGAPMVEGAFVTLTDGITGQTVASGTTDTNGIVTFANVPETTYQLTVSAQQHSIYQSPATIVPGTLTKVSAFLNYQAVTYRWTVVPTEVQDTYRVVLDTVFETAVPIPVVTIDNPMMMPLVVPGEDTQLTVKVTNHGLIAAEQVQITVPYHENYEIVSLIDRIDVLPAQSTMEIPIIIRLRQTGTAVALHQVGLHGDDFGCGKTFTGCAVFPKYSVKWSYVCGPDRHWHISDAQIIPVCVSQSCWEAIQDKLKDKLQELAKSGGNIKDLLEWKGLLCDALGLLNNCLTGDACIETILGMVCGVATGDVVGAISSALGFGQCWCPSLPSLPRTGGTSGPDGSGGGFGPGGSGPGGPSDPVPVPIFWDYSPNCTPGETQDYSAGASGGIGYRMVAVPHVSRGVSQPATAVMGKPRSSGGGGSVCARVRLRLEQQAVVTRAAFLGTLEVDNGRTDISLTNIQVTLDFRDSDHNPANDKFAVGAPVLSGLTAVDGTGSIAPSATGRAQWTFLPTHDAAPDQPTVYWVGGTLKYYEGDSAVEVPLMPATITVYPDPILHLKYFWQRDVLGDDPFTADTEPSVPFALGLLVQNTGKGAALHFKITSAQPKIIENQKGLLINFKIIGSQMGDQAVDPSLTLDMGQIDPATSKVGLWWMTSTLQGKFIDYKASFEHLDNLGNAHVSLIDSVDIHELIHVVQADRANDDDVPDFLVNDVPDSNNLPDTLYESDGSIASVSVATDSQTDGQVSMDHMQVQLTASMGPGWTYLQVPDPGADYRLGRVVRSDGKPVKLGLNAWTTDRSFPASQAGAAYENLLHLLDYDSPGTYTLYYTTTNATAPTIVKFGDLAPFQTTPVDGIDVEFSEPIDLTTFDYHDLALTLNGGPDLITADIALSQISGPLYHISGLTALTAADGNYLLTVDASGIADIAGNVGTASRSVGWAKGSTAPVAVGLQPVQPNPRNQPVDSLDIIFSKPIDVSTLDSSDFSLTLGGGPNLIPTGLSLRSLSSTMFRAAGLGGLTVPDGDYVFTINMANVKDTAGDSGTGTLSTGWTMDTAAPQIASLEDVQSPRNIVVQSLLVTFSKPIVPGSFDYHALTLRHNAGDNLITSDVKVAQVNGTTFRVSNFTWVIGYDGTYILTVDASGVTDLAGNRGRGTMARSWVMSTHIPDPPSAFAISPDTGVSATDGLTSSNRISFKGLVPRTGLDVQVYDDTTGDDLGFAAVTGTNFTLSITFRVSGLHKLRVVSIDEAANASMDVFYNVFVDQAGPTASWSTVLDPQRAPIPSVDLTFSKPIDTNTLNISEFSLQFNGGPNLLTGKAKLNSLGNDSYRLSGLTTLTGTAGRYTLALAISSVRDLAGNSGVGPALVSWTLVAPNVGPVLSAISDRVVAPGELLIVTNQVTDSDLPPPTLTFSLDPGAPSAMVIDPATGILRWHPTTAQSHTTYPVTVTVTDNNVPRLSSSQTFNVTVEDYVALSLSDQTLHVGDVGNTPIILRSSAAVQAIEFTLASPGDVLTNFAVRDLASQITSSSLTPVEGGLRISLTAGAGQSLQGVTQIAALTYKCTRTNQPSGVVLLQPDALSATLVNSVPAKLTATSGRVTIVGQQLLLQAVLTPGSTRGLVLFAPVGTPVEIQTSTNLLAWQPWQSLTTTSLATRWESGLPNNRGLFVRAVESSGRQGPLLRALLGTGGLRQLSLDATVGSKIQIQTSTDLRSWQDWQLVTVTNRSTTWNSGLATDRTLFIRAIQQP